jgi:hypothetical protein
MHGLFHPPEEYAGPSILTVGVLCFVFFLGCMLEFSSESAYLPFVAHDISIVVLILEFYHLD